MAKNKKRYLNLTIFPIIFTLLCTSSAKQPKIDPNLLCSESYCDEYLSENKCQELSEECQAQNSTHSGTVILSPVFCNCCDYCLTHLEEGDICSKGGLGYPPTGTICGPGLTCTSIDENTIPTCQRMESECHSAQDDYDKRREDGTLGFLEQRPICDGSGDYGQTACIPGQTCFCTSKEGKKIFGEILNIRTASKDMTCECSRKTDTIKKLLVSKLSYGPRCTSDGSFDELQCVGKRCFCVFKDTGMLSSNIIIDNTAELLSKLPCYNESIHHSPTSYFKPCEEIKYEIIQKVIEYEENGFTYLGDPVPNCQADGYYHPVQKQGDRKICVTPDGKQIKNFGANQDSENMHCNCARTLNLLESSTSVSATPECCSDGSWKRIQCRQKYCYCVNQFDGRQEGMEKEIKDINALECYSDNWQEC